MVIGVLAFHGDVAEHLAVLRSLKVAAKEIRTVAALEDCTHLIIPGGESTVIAKFLHESGLDKLIRIRVSRGDLAVYGTCAGAILLAKKATGLHAPDPLGLIDMTVDRNAYGSQMQSFDALVHVKGLKKPLPVAFIRAPKITNVAQSVGILAEYGGSPVLVRQGRMLAGTFHPEVRGETAVHEIFL